MSIDNKGSERKSRDKVPFWSEMKWASIWKMDSKREEIRTRPHIHNTSQIHRHDNQVRGPSLPQTVYSVRGLELSELGGSHGCPGRFWDRFLEEEEEEEEI